MNGLLPAPGNDGMGAYELAEAVADYETPIGDYLAAKFGEGFWSSLPGQGAAQLRTSTAIDTVNMLGQAAERSPYAQRYGIPPHEDLPPAEPVLSEDQWKASPWYREKLAWDPRMTETRAQALADIFDDNNYRRWLIDRSPDGARSVAGFGAALLGGAADPVNYIPVFGPAARAATAARLARALGPNAAKVLAPASLNAAEAAIGTAATVPILQESQRQFGDDVGFAEAALDVAFGAAFGALLGGGAGAWRLYRDRGLAPSQEAGRIANDAINQAVADLAGGRSVRLRLEQEQLLAARRQVQEGLALLRADASAVPGPAGEVLATLTPETMQGLAVEIRRGAAIRQGEEIAVPKRGGEGLIKLEIRHPDVTDAELAALPVALREQEGELFSSAGQTQVWEWRRNVDGVEVHYRLKERLDEDPAKRYLLTIFRETDPAKRKGETAKRKPAGQDPLASTGRLDRDTARAFSVQSPEGLAQPAGQTIAQAAENAITPSGRRVPVRYEVVELADLVASHGDDLEANPAFPAALQPRDRARTASAAQIAELAGRLDPELLGRTAAAGDGAPIVGPDNVVESGNGRTLALRRAYAQGLPGAERYRAFLTGQGFDVAGMAAPVLVRRRIGELAEADRIAFTREANERSTLAMGIAERARADAAALPDQALDLYEGGDLDTVANQAFARAFLETVAPAERGALITADGRLSQDGLRRLQAALLAKAYDDPHLVASLLESTDDNLKGIGQALLAAAPEWIRLRAGVLAGDVVADMDQTAALLQAVALVRQAREKRIKVRDLADQLDMFDPAANTVRSFAQLMYGPELSRAVSAKQLGIALGRYADQAQLNLSGPRLFGDALSAGDILATMINAGPRLVDTAAPAPEIPAAPAKVSPGIAGRAAELGIELGDSAVAARFDEEIALQQVEAAGRLRADEAAALAAARELAERADTFAGGYEAAAVCLARRAA